jgi:polysaccharide chain length determinant protein (PEP-CTERM system associated)
MMRNGEITVAEVRRILRRYWWIPPILTVLLGLAGYLTTMALPKKFTSSTLVLVEEPTVPADFVKPVVTEDLNRRLASMQEQILSRSRLQPIIEKFNLYADLRGKAHMEDLVEQLRKNIEVELSQPMPGAVNRQPPGFHVSVTFNDPQIAQQICTEITSMFMQQNVKRREQQAADTTQFLSQQLAEAKAKLDEQDQKLAEYKTKYLGSLPEQEQSNLGLLSGMNTQLESVTQSLSRAQQDKAFNETMLSQQEASWKSQQAGQQNPDTLEQQVAAMQDQLVALQARDTPNHPDVIKLKSEIEQLKRRMAEDPGTKSPVTSAPSTLREPPLLQQLRAKLKQDEMSIADLAKQQTQIREQIRTIQARVQASPMVEQQFKELTRNYQTASEIYNDLLKKRENSAMATDLEHQQESETFKVLDPPSLPLTPSFPNKLVFAGGGLGAGFALSLAMLYVLALSDRAMHSERDVELCLKLPVLAAVPSFDIAGHGATIKAGRGKTWHWSQQRHNNSDGEKVRAV